MATATEKIEVDYPASDGAPMGETGRHVRAIFTLYEGLRDRFADRDDVYFDSKIFIYYKEGHSGSNKCPDCMVIFGVGNHERRAFKTWEEGASPSAIFGVSSPERFREDIGEKLETYARLGVPEDYLFDPTGECPDHPPAGYRLNDGNDDVVRPDADGALQSPSLGLRVLPVGKRLRLVDPATSQFIPSGVEKRRVMDAAVEDARRARLDAERANLRAGRAGLQVEEARSRFDRLELKVDQRTAELDRLKQGRADMHDPDSRGTKDHKIMASGTYNADSITVLEGLEAVRKRPGMYIGGVDKSGLHHLLWEVVDNSVDEVMNGHASKITVALHADGKTMTVADNGRGIPVDIHPKSGLSALEVIFTKLHAGGKFDNDAYKVAGGLHGVGASVVNALSKSLVAEVRRDGITYTQKFRRGKPDGPVSPGDPARGTGTTITFTPDPEIFGDQKYDADLIRERLEVKTYLNKGLSINFADEKAKESVEFRHDGGVADFLEAVNKARDDQRVGGSPFVLERDDDDLRIDLAICWTEATDEDVRSYVNTIPTRDGGTHEQGLRKAVGVAVRRFMETHDLIRKGVEIKEEDIREGLVAVLSVCVREPQFQGQTKDRLNNVEVRSLVESAVRPRLEDFLLKNRSVGDAVAARVIQAAKAREASRAAASQVRRKTPVNNRLNLPGKLADCDSDSPEETELFIVEGDSAGGSAKQGRNRDTQAVLPLRGKVLNVEQAGREKLLENKELTNLVSALGCGIDGQYDASRLRYGKVILLSDADSDGHHIATLLLTFFYRHMPALLDEGRVYLACPPLYKVSHGKETHWAADDAGRDRILSRLPSNAKPTITRFKGLGEMPAPLLFETTLDPARRRLLRVVVPDDDRPYTESTVSDLMGKEPEARFKFIMAEAYTAKDIDI